MSDTLFPRGFVLTSSASVAERAEKLLPGWRQNVVADAWWLLVNPEPALARPGKPTSKPADLPSGVLSAGLDRGSAVLLMGHAVDPWNGLSGPEILQALRRSLPPGRLPQARDCSLWEILDSLTGRFVLAVLDRRLPWIVQDAVGLQPLFYSSGTEAFAASSHAQLLAEVMGLERDPMVDELVTSRFYRKGLQHLPGLRTPFLGMKMLTPNTFLDVKGHRVVRFFPREAHGPVEDWNALVEESAGVLTRSVQMLSREYEVAVPLSRGVGGQTLLAACRPVAGQLVFFSRGSNGPGERDAPGAWRLWDAPVPTHESYPVDVKAYGASPDPELEALLSRNAAGVRRPEVGEVAKLKTLLEQFPPGRMVMESHGSEIGLAAFWNSLGSPDLSSTLTPRHMTSLYGWNLFNRRLRRWADECFEELWTATGFAQSLHDYEEPDLFYWEHRIPQWAALASQDHDLVHDTTSVFNNRRLLVNFLKPERRARLTDHLHSTIIFTLWPEAMKAPLPPGPGLKTVMGQALRRWLFERNA